MSIGTPDIFTSVIVGYFSTTIKMPERDHSCAQLHSFNSITNHSSFYAYLSWAADRNINS